jgi:carboxyl-terminal processing protease
MRFRFAALTLLFAAALPSSAQPALTAAQRQLNIDSFEMVWQTVRDKHWDPNLGGLNWQAIHDELRPKVEKAATLDEARGVMADMLDRLKQTHFGIVPADAYQEMGSGGDDADKDAGPREGSPGIEARVIDNHVLVTSIEPDSPAAAAGVQPGWEILKIDGKDLAPGLSKIRASLAAQASPNAPGSAANSRQAILMDLVQAHAISNRLSGNVGKAVEVEFLNGKDKKVSMKINRAKPRGQVAQMGNLPPMHFWAEARTLKPNIGYVRFNLFFEPDSLIGVLQKAVKECKACDGFVLDLRGNPGGIGGLATGVAGWFTDKPGQKLGSMYMRAATGTNQIKFAIFPRPEPFLGPLAILVDGSSASTSEVLAGGMQDMHRAHIVGTHTAGAALPSIFTRLPNGDGFQYAIANYISDGGKPLEGLGVTPDEEVKLTRHQLLEGQDPVIEAAVTWIEKQKK